MPVERALEPLAAQRVAADQLERERRVDARRIAREPAQLVAPGERPRERRADGAAGAGDQDPHRRHCREQAALRGGRS